MVFGCIDESFGAFSFVQFGSCQVGYQVRSCLAHSGQISSGLVGFKQNQRQAKIHQCSTQVLLGPGPDTASGQVVRLCRQVRSGQVSSRSRSVKVVRSCCHVRSDQAGQLSLGPGLGPGQDHMWWCLQPVLLVLFSCTSARDFTVLLKIEKSCFLY